VLALKAYGLSASRVLPYALVLHAVNLIPFLIVGFGLVLYNARHPPPPRLPPPGPLDASAVRVPAAR
jgi:hypothetical protein